ncbi:hypothetical protein HYS47_01555 [Candidatus Woesearchaeota archaeon]|nr:hypothetical protein [Candidatus Woesearchaeota archaeon]
MKKTFDVYTAIVWASLLSILIWALLKSFGIINTPDVIKMWPLVSAVFGAGAFFQKFLQLNEKVAMMEQRLTNVKTRLTIVETKITAS